MKRTRRITRRGTALLVVIVLAAASLVACIGSSTPPGANKYLGTFEQAGYLALRWEEGLDLMLWYDITGSATAQSAGSTQDDVYVEQGSARAADGRSLEWQVRTRNGRTGEVWIDGLRYNPAEGNVFLIRSWGGTTRVEQLQRDLSAVPLDHDSIVAFAAEDPELLPFTGAGPTPD